MKFGKIIRVAVLLCGFANASALTDEAHRSVLRGKLETVKNTVSLLTDDDMMRTFEPAHLAEALTRLCTNKQSFTQCVEEFLQKSSDSLPWWLETQLSDMEHEGVQGFWHNQTFGHIEMCTIEKIGTSQWRAIFKRLNKPSAGNAASSDQPKARFVFLRDPLERFLSGYLDKCESYHQKEKHCEPLQLFGPDAGNIYTRKEFTHKQKFEEYVAAMPGKWDLHFFPQAFYCNGLYRQISSYDFIGKMDRNFYNDLHRLLETSPFSENTQFVQEVSNHFKLSATVNTVNTGTETHAYDRVNEFYSPETVRRVMEYYAIDYDVFNLSVPSWAKTMLGKGE